MNSKTWIKVGWLCVAAFLCFSLYAAWRTRHETIANESEISRVREIQVQRGERIGAVEARVSALEPNSVGGNALVRFDWQHGLVDLGVVLEKGASETRAAFRASVVDDFNFYIAAIPPKE